MQDIINACFELFGFYAVVRNVFAIRRDKEVKGLDVMAVCVFTVWGVWNAYFYGHLNQLFSQIAGIMICLANFVYTYYLFKYRSDK